MFTDTNRDLDRDFVRLSGNRHLALTSQFKLGNGGPVDVIRKNQQGRHGHLHVFTFSMIRFQFRWSDLNLILLKRKGAKLIIRQINRPPAARILLFEADPLFKHITIHPSRYGEHW